MKVSWAVIALCFVGAALAICPNDCSAPNGQCNSASICICTAGWTGDDCSVADIELRNHVPETGSVAQRKWQYYHFVANSVQQSVEFEVNQTSVSMDDCDMYLRLGQYPKRGSGEYDMRDISVSRTTRFEVQSPHGVYYLGVYGFTGCDYVVRATLKSSCPNDCSGHGSCNYDGTCTCQDGFLGLDCSTSVISLQNGVQVQSSVGLRQFRYFKLHNTQNTVKINLNQDVATDDVDLYVRLNAVPTLTSFDYRDTGTMQQTEMNINDARTGDYYIGVYGFTQLTSFNIKATAFSQCPNTCSGPTHGSCSTNFLCSCSADYTGSACETKISPLTLDARVESGYVSGNMWNYYKFNSYTENNILVSLHQTEMANSDCDLYIRQGENPTRFTFDYRDIGYTQDIGITVTNPGLTTWYIGVYGYRPCTYQLSALITQTCPNGCTDAEHGTCGTNGHCQCKENWTGDDCSVRLNLLSNGVTVDSSVAPGVWKYYSFTARPGSPVTIAMKEVESTGYIWLYEAFGQNPTLSSFDTESSETNTNIHRAVIAVPADGTVHIGVYGSIFGHAGTQYRFKLVAYQNQL